jgi:hypothetical protein
VFTIPYAMYDLVTLGADVRGGAISEAVSLSFDPVNPRFEGVQYSDDSIDYIGQVLDVVL